MRIQNKVTTTDANSDFEALVALVRGGCLPATEENAEKVWNAYANALFWGAVFRDAGLEHLPDPEGVSEEPELLEVWLVEAYRDNFDTEDECRAAIHQSRDDILAAHAAPS